jgi:hypothetical protein
MKRYESQVEGSVAARLGCAAAAAVFSAAIIGVLVAAMAPTGHDVAQTLAVDAARTPLRIEVVGTRAPTIVRSVAAPRVG